MTTEQTLHEINWLQNLHDCAIDLAHEFLAQNNYKLYEQYIDYAEKKLDEIEALRSSLGRHEIWG